MMNNLDKFMSIYAGITEKITEVFSSLSLLVLRILVARVFFLSGLTKWLSPFEFNTDKYDLFLYEYFCPDPPVEGALQLCNPETLDYVQGSMIVSAIEMLAIATGVLEITLPILLVLGLFTRFSALLLLAMTLFIQLAVFPGWEHWWNPAAWWAVSLLTVLSFGPGNWSLDRVFKLDSLRRGR